MKRLKYSLHKYAIIYQIISLYYFTWNLVSAFFFFFLLFSHTKKHLNFFNLFFTFSLIPIEVNMKFHLFSKCMLWIILQTKFYSKWIYLKIFLFFKNVPHNLSLKYHSSIFWRNHGLTYAWLIQTFSRYGRKICCYFCFIMISTSFIEKFV